MLPHVKKILYATDLSENSAYAFYFAVDIAQKHDAEIIILHAVEPISPAVMPYIEREKVGQIEKESVADAVGEIKSRLQNFCRYVESQIGPPCVDLVSKTLVPLGHASEEILNNAEKESCDLIILGTHGKGFLVHTFLGSVSRKVLDRARKPVLIVPLPQGEQTNWGRI